MYQTDRGSYRKKETLSQQFRHSCLGQIIIGAVTIAILLILSAILNPSEETMNAEMRDNVHQCIIEKDSLNNDWIDDIVDNSSYIFTSADTTKELEMMQAFDTYNKLKHYSHTFFSTVYLHNNMLPQGKRCGVGIFGVVIPMLNYNDLLLQDELMQSDTINQKIFIIKDNDEANRAVISGVQS